MTPRTAPPPRRPRNAMPVDVRRALLAAGLMMKYRQRPPYQRNDYLGWIRRAKRPATRQKRMQQMLEELSRGHSYMKMSYRPAARRG